VESVTAAGIKDELRQFAEPCYKYWRNLRIGDVEKQYDQYIREPALLGSNAIEVVLPPMTAQVTI